MNTIHSYIWTISRFELDVKQDGEFTIVKKVPKGETQETIVADDKNLFEKIEAKEKELNAQVEYLQ